jgi:hypothetical protein
MTVKTLRRQLAAAIAMTLVSTVALGSSTYAWFTMNKQVSVTGMTMKTTVSGNLLISDNNVEADYSTEQLTQTRAALLEPVSSISGADGSFWFTTHALGNGDAVDDASYIAYNENTELTGSAKDLITNGDSTTAGTHPATTGAGKAAYALAFNNGSGSYQIPTHSTTADVMENAYGYVDYVFYLKATGDGDDTLIKLTDLNLLKPSDTAIDNTGKTTGIDADRAWRVAVFCSELSGAANQGLGLTSAVQASNATTANLKAILTLANAANHSGSKAIASNAAPVDLAPIASYNTWSDATNTNIGTVANGTTKYFKVTLRLWLEGEDTTCNSTTYAKLTDVYSLSAKFDLTHNGEGGVAAVTEIGSVAP